MKALWNSASRKRYAGCITVSSLPTFAPKKRSQGITRRGSSVPAQLDIGHTDIPCFATVCFTPRQFYERFTVVPISLTERNLKGIFPFTKKGGAKSENSVQRLFYSGLPQRPRTLVSEATLYYIFLLYRGYVFIISFLLSLCQCYFRFYVTWYDLVGYFLGSGNAQKFSHVN